MLANAGTGYINVRGIGGYYGELSIPFKINSSTVEHTIPASGTIYASAGDKIKCTGWVVASLRTSSGSTVKTFESTSSSVGFTYTLSRGTYTLNYNIYQCDGETKMIMSGGSYVYRTTYTKGALYKSGSVTIIVSDTSSSKNATRIVPGTSKSIDFRNLFLTVEPYYSDEVITGTVTWSSSDTSVAVVDNGNVNILCAGNVTITALYNGATAEWNLDFDPIDIANANCFYDCESQELILTYNELCLIEDTDYSVAFVENKDNISLLAITGKNLFGETTYVCVDTTTNKLADQKTLCKFNKHKFTKYTSNSVATCIANATEVASCDYGCGKTNVIEVKDTKLGHIGGTATCINKAVCTRCHKEYGSVDSSKHMNTELRGVVAATCTKDGYDGDWYCKDCGVRTERGETVPKLGHKGGVATCINRAICSVCGQFYGAYNPTNHLITELINDRAATETTDGYTGDYFCYECGRIVKAGTKINKLISVGQVTNLKASSAGKNCVKLTWTPVSGAVGYLVYGFRGTNGKYGFIGVANNANAYTDTKALDNDYNFYWVFAYVKASNGQMVTGSCQKYVYAKGVTLPVTNLKAISQVGSAKLTWTAVSGADGYLIYGYHGSPKDGATYGYIGMTSGSTTYVDTKAVASDWNYYYVFPFHYDANHKMVVGGTAKYVYAKALQR